MTIRANIAAMAGYVPGEQPHDDGIVKLNTNENPYPPSPRVFEAIRAALTGERLRKYPDPAGLAFCKVAARLHDVEPASILIGNGSDDLLTIITRAFVPEGGLVVSPTPSYLLYHTLAEIQGARFVNVPYRGDWSLPTIWPEPDAHLTFVADPNSPSGTQVPAGTFEQLKDQLHGPLVIDEAYVDFADRSSVHLAGRPGIIITRTLSKSYSLAGVRFGYAIADPALIRELVKVKDSYNCDTLSLAAATAALDDQEYLGLTRTRILASRARLTAALGKLGFIVTPSQANFVWCTHSSLPARWIFETLKERRILVRYMNYAGFGDGLRITVGMEIEIGRLLDELATLVR